MNQDLRGRLYIVLHCSQVVTFWMPGKPTHNIFVGNCEDLLAFRLKIEFPFGMSLFLGKSCSFSGISIFCKLEHAFCSFIDSSSSKARSNDMNLFFICDSKHVVVYIWAPFNAIYNLVVKLVLPQNFCCSRAPNDEIVLLIT